MRVGEQIIKGNKKVAKQKKQVNRIYFPLNLTVGQCGKIFLDLQSVENNQFQNK